MNKVYYFDGKTFIPYHDNLDISISINGDNNFILLFKPKFKNARITINNNNNNIIIIRNSKRFISLNVLITANDNIIYINEDFQCGIVNFLLHEPYTTIKIGSHCLFSSDIMFMNSDAHCILKNDIISNYSQGITIGDHVWIGRGSMILKNVCISNDSIVGANSVVTGKFNDSNIILAGNPARIIKKDITWTHKSQAKYCEDYEKILNDNSIKIFDIKDSQYINDDNFLKKIIAYNENKKRILENVTDVIKYYKDIDNHSIIQLINRYNNK